jgi:phenylacetic acid degradation operon negative regulatory protein
VRSRLSWAGFGTLGAGLWISPHPEREAEATQVLRDAGVAQDAHVFVATRPGLADVRVMVTTAWDLTAIEEQYEQFIEEFRAGAPADILARQIELVHAWRRFPSIDPVLPRELLPARWSGLEAARLFADRHERWSADARQEWKRLNELGLPPRLVRPSHRPATAPAPLRAKICYGCLTNRLPGVEHRTKDGRAEGRP